MKIAVPAGSRVVIRVGRVAGLAGRVVKGFREPDCPCRSIIVRLDNGRTWVGRASEVRPA